MIEKLHSLDDDGLITPEVGAWAEYKYRLVSNYANMFASSMKGKWGARVYIDLFAGAGRSKIENSKQIVPASPVLALALALPYPFGKYIFCDNEEDKLQALEKRVKRDYPRATVTYIEDANAHVNTIIEAIPQHSSTYRVLSFCFADPYSLKNLKFSTIKSMMPIRSTDRNLPLYHLAFFSRHKKGADFWKEAKKYSTDQLSLL